MSTLRRVAFVTTHLLLALVLSSEAMAQAGAAYDARKATATKAAPGRTLAAAAQSGRADTVRSYLQARGASQATANSLRETSANTTRTGITHVRLEQEVNGLAVHGRYVKAALNARGELVHLIENVAPVPAAAPAEPRISAQRALQSAMARVHPGMQPAFEPSGATGNTMRFNGGAFFASDPSVTRVAVPLSDGTLAVGYLVETWTRRDNQLHETLVGGDGEVLHVESRTARDSYNIFPVDPSKGPQTIVQGPGSAGNAQSPVGWLGTGTQTTWSIGGNNVRAYLDADANNRVDAGGTAVLDGNFLTAATLTESPATAANRAVAIQNLFYLNNVIHDLLYRHGFNEAAGNFQQDNFGKGGSGSDPVDAEAQDGSGTDNANFATPRDGRPPRMQMFLWTGAGATHLVAVNPSGPNYGAMGAEFGPALTASGVTGNLVAASPADGCTAISTPLAGKVALVDRGTCEFSTKVLNAQNAGAVAVIVANNQGATAIFTMGAGSAARRVRIPSVMVSQNDGGTLRSLGSPSVTVSKPAVQPVMIDSALDSDVVYHEYAHGLTWRMIGGMSGPLSGAVGEGMSDAISMLVNGDDVMSEYSSSNPLGIRRYRYEGYPLTYGSVTGAEVHDDGEPFAAIVWRMMKLFGDRGREQLFRYVIDGMNYTPSYPAYEDMRDGMLAAIANDPDAGRACTLVWKAFADFGVGVNAKGTVLQNGSVQVTEDFTPGACP